jgi:putative ATP-dependent endonuclease of OLD family
MRISRITIQNFANFSDLDVSIGENIVIVGENKIGKSNLVFALRLILDPSLSERDRTLTLDHFWDGLGEDKLGETVEIAIELTDYDGDARLVAHLGDCIVEVGPPMVSRITYRFQPKEDLEGEPDSLADYEYIIFGGTDPNNSVGAGFRRMVPLEVIDALRDAEKDLSSWRNSPLRPLIEALGTSLDDDARREIESEIKEAQTELTERDEVKEVAERIEGRLVTIVGDQHATSLQLGLSETKADSLLRALRLFIDNGSRGMSEASLGTANLIFFALKSLELDLLAADQERDHTFLAVEEPEAHLHPHIQRLVFRYFLQSELAAEEQPRAVSTILTTHSPHIASVAPPESIVLLKSDGESTVAFSTADADLGAEDLADLKRYIDVTRGELYFARGIIFVEGDAERFLLPAFAEELGIDLDELGITIASVSGTNFTPYAKLVGPDGLNVPSAFLTDLDPVEGKSPRAVNRLKGLLAVLAPDEDTDVDDPDLFALGEDHGIFVNDNTLEPVLFEMGLEEEMQEILLEELPRLSAASKTRIQEWVDDPGELDAERLIAFIERVGKGRFAQKLASEVTAATCPAYIREALEFIRDELA